MLLIVRPIEFVPLLLIFQHMDALTHSLDLDNCLEVTLYYMDALKHPY